MIATRAELRSMIFDRAFIGGLDSCWQWGKATKYGVLHVGAKNLKAHRVVWEFFRGEIPHGYQIHHICEDKSCVNPRHLMAVTPGEHRELHNFAQVRALGSAKRRDRTHCTRGHEFNEENTYWARKGRQCRACHRQLQRLRREKARRS